MSCGPVIPVQPPQRIWDSFPSRIGRVAGLPAGWVPTRRVGSYSRGSSPFNTKRPAPGYNQPGRKDYFSPPPAAGAQPAARMPATLWNLIHRLIHSPL